MRQLLRLLPIAVAAALVVPAMTPTVVQAQSVDEQRERVEDIVNELERLEEKANQIAEDYVEAIDDKTHLDAEIVEAEARVAAKEAELAELRANLGEMAIRSFVGSGSTPLGLLFEDSANVNDVLTRDELARVALSTGNVTTDELDAAVEDLEAEKSDLDRKRDEAAQIAETLQAAQAETERLTNDYVSARADAEAKLGQLIAEEEERRARESAERLAAEFAAQQAAAASNSANSGGSSNNSGGGNSGGSSNNSGGSSSSSGGGNSGGGNSGGGGSGGGSSGGTSSPPPAVSSRAGIAVQAAMSQQGVPYKYATSNPGVSFDCSGLTSYAWGQAGVYLPHQSRAQFASIPHVAKAAAQPGDLVFYYSPISHVGVYIGGGKLVHAPNTGSVVNVATVNWNKVVGVGRPG